MEDYFVEIATGQIDPPKLSEEQKWKNFNSQEDNTDREEIND